MLVSSMILLTDNLSWTTVLVHGLINGISKRQNLIHSFIVSWLDVLQQIIVSFSFEPLETVLLLWGLVVVKRSGTVHLTLNGLVVVTNYLLSLVQLPVSFEQIGFH